MAGAPALKSPLRMGTEFTPSHWSSARAYTERKSVSYRTSPELFSSVGLPPSFRWPEGYFDRLTEEEYAVLANRQAAKDRKEKAAEDRD